ncbi:Rpn family recombination-promoting nuclease/putative transposase [Spirulina sp. CCNP1310]|uniref:Rpn family recombination-promoting nuclease/putative transposase n=1 Tax=Spirulina sp. CCNP1310 TaxID=3110249 RepID=UPI002B22029A|nr:Rpn family recombination-promoting nuclease/putative transposase [Spirulina sp. CCNP1310]MEA5419543.1 Rpn family recombination-promoting nuclease/putative transposase [Spirulina sp. CCNP1310]
MAYTRYINPLTDFGFKRIFGTEANKAIIIDFLNTLLPPHHQIQDLTYKNTENLGNTPLDRRAFFDIYCQASDGQRFIVEMQKVKQDYFKDRSIYYATFAIQEQAEKGYWNYQLLPVYTVAILDFIFDEHQDDEELIHIIKLKDQHCRTFHEKLQFIYIELPKFTKPLEELETPLDQWLYVLQHLSELSDRPDLLQENPVFNQLFELAEFAGLSRSEQGRYENSLKYYRDWNNVMNTARREGREEGREEGWQEGQQVLILRQLRRKLGELPEEIQFQIAALNSEDLADLGERLFDLSTVADLQDWLAERC